MSKRIIAAALIVLMITGDSFTAFSWGFWAHKRINRLAVFTLPPEMTIFYKKHIEFVTHHAVDADKRRYATENEAPRHYIDLDHYGEYPFADVPRKWSDAVEKFSEDTLNEYGIVPWHVNLMLYNLTNAFKTKSLNGILRISADLGHYIADAHVPLHTTENYNGQLTGQKGIHAFWETRVPEVMGEEFNYFVGKAEYIEDPPGRVWDVILSSAAAVDSVLGMERELSRIFEEDQKYTYAKRGDQTVRLQSEEYTRAYNDRLNNMVERRMRMAVKSVGDFWFTAWVNAGQPDLSELGNVRMTREEQKKIEEEEKAWQEGSIKGRDH